VLDLARDDGKAAVAEGGNTVVPGLPAALIAFPEYGPGGMPLTTAERRARLQGYLVAAITPQPVVETSLTPDACASLRSPSPTGRSCSTAHRRPVLRGSASCGARCWLANRTWTVTAWAGPGALPSRPPEWALVLALAALLSSITSRRPSGASRSSGPRPARRELVPRRCGSSPMPARCCSRASTWRAPCPTSRHRPGAAVRPRPNWVSRSSTTKARPSKTFAIGPTPAAGRAMLDVRRSTPEVAAGQDFTLALLRTGRTVGALRARGRRPPLDENQLRSLRAVADPARRRPRQRAALLARTGDGCVACATSTSEAELPQHRCRTSCAPPSPPSKGSARSSSSTGKTLSDEQRR